MPTRSERHLLYIKKRRSRIIQNVEEKSFDDEVYKTWSKFLWPSARSCDNPVLSGNQSHRARLKGTPGQNAVRPGPRDARNVRSG